MRLPVDEKCVEAMYNLIISLAHIVESTELERRSNAVGQYAYAMIGRNVNADLLDYWSKQVEERCGVKWDEEIADRTGVKQETDLAKSLSSMIMHLTGKAPEEMEAEAEQKKKEALGAMYG